MYFYVSNKLEVPSDKRLQKKKIPGQKGGPGPPGPTPRSALDKERSPHLYSIVFWFCGKCQASTFGRISTPGLIMFLESPAKS